MERANQKPSGIFKGHCDMVLHTFDRGLLAYWDGNFKYGYSTCKNTYTTPPYELASHDRHSTDC